MKYMLMIYVTEDDMNREPAPGVMDQHLAMTEAAIERNAYVTCDALEPSANAVQVRVRDGEVLRADGPFAESKEIVGGFYMVDCANIDEACDIAAKIPQPDHGWIEVRPVATIPGWDEAVEGIRAKLARTTV